MTRPPRYLSRLLTVGLVVAAIGCREETAVVSGVVLLDGNPLAITKGVRGTVVFQPASRQGPTLNGLIDVTGHYELASGANKLVSPGVYMATVSAVEILLPSDEDSRPEGRLITPAKYASVSDSGLRFVVEPGMNDIWLQLYTDATTDGETSLTSPEHLEKAYGPPAGDVDQTQ